MPTPEQRAEKAAYMRQWTAKNKERLNRERRERRKNDPEYRARSNEESRRAYHARSHEITLEYRRKWRNANRAHKNAKGREYYWNHVDEERARGGEYRAKHKDEMRRASAAWAKANPDKCRAKKQRYRARKNGMEGCFSDIEWKEVCLWYDYRCVACGKREKLNADHVIPVGQPGSTNYISNIQPLCHACNSGKLNKAIDYRPMFFYRFLPRYESDLEFVEI